MQVPCLQAVTSPCMIHVNRGPALVSAFDHLQHRIKQDASARDGKGDRQLADNSSTCAPTHP